MNFYDILFAKKLSGGGGVAPTGTLEITENGSYDVKQYATVSVDIPSSGGDDMFIVGLTFNSADKTFSEVKEAFKDGKIIVFKYLNSHAFAMANALNPSSFVAFFIRSTGSDSIDGVKMEFNSNDAVLYSTFEANKT